MLLHSGFTAHYCVQMMLDDEPDANGKIVLTALSEKLEGGASLSGAMEETKLFPQYLYSMIEIGEKTGRLTETLKALSIHYKRQENLSTSIKNATLYPAVLLGMMIIVVMILIVQVLPIFNDVFGRMGTQMSPFAVRLMDFGTWFRAASIVITIVAAAVFLLVLIVWLVPSFKEGLAKSLKNRFGGRGIFGRIALYQFVSSMSLALSSGLSVKEAVELAASLNKDSKSLDKKYNNCLSLLEEGGKLSDALHTSGLLSARDSRMLSIGDSSGMVDTAMTEIAERNDEIIQAEISRIVSRIEPTLVVLTSAIVGVILLSVMLPLVGIMTSIG